ncbi:hypothetical protein [Azospirillum sp. ST 5-10]|uniref:hypothetical protein n=1 Tax=unclassified Azospirillum TaxID=2630922 RepID=UPI003F4A6612
MLALSDAEVGTLRAFVIAVEGEVGIWGQVVAAMADAGIANPDEAFAALRRTLFAPPPPE